VDFWAFSRRWNSTPNRLTFTKISLVTRIAIRACSSERWPSKSPSRHHRHQPNTHALRNSVMSDDSNATRMARIAIACSEFEIARSPRHRRRPPECAKFGRVIEQFELTRLEQGSTLLVVLGERFTSASRALVERHREAMRTTVINVLNQPTAQNTHSQTSTLTAGARGEKLEPWTVAGVVDRERQIPRLRSPSLRGTRRWLYEMTAQNCLIAREVAVFHSTSALRVAIARRARSKAAPVRGR